MHISFIFSSSFPHVSLLLPLFSCLASFLFHSLPLLLLLSSETLPANECHEALGPNTIRRPSQAHPTHRPPPPLKHTQKAQHFLTTCARLGDRKRVYTEAQGGLMHSGRLTQIPHMNGHSISNSTHSHSFTHAQAIYIRLKMPACVHAQCTFHIHIP